MRKGKLINIIISNRTEKALDRILENNREYQAALKERDEVFRKLDQIQSNREKGIISRVLDANNHCGAVYGEAAYRLGLQDGLNLAMELRTLCR